ncbi:uncharacterized protein LOC142588938 [Dermacentor variabilis]|uniref:uncharacterized protein LOC142588938 n=1 Tax=Dermacentor variabilis TaxID=34621 RepID=UPI003F5B95AF
MSRASFNDVLIDEVAMRPLLWNAALNDYKKISNRSALWDEVLEAMRTIDPNVTMDEIQSRWKNLKDTFRRKLKDVKDEQRSGSAATKKTKSNNWPYMERLRFMSDLFEPRRSHSNISPDEQNCAYDSTAAEETLVILEDHCENEEIFEEILAP